MEDDSLRIAELTNDVIVDEVGYNSPSSLSEGFYLNTFSVTLCCSQDPYVAFIRWIDRTNEVESLGVKWLVAMELDCSNVDSIDINLACLAAT